MRGNDFAQLVVKRLDSLAVVGGLLETLWRMIEDRIAILVDGGSLSVRRGGVRDRLNLGQGRQIGEKFVFEEVWTILF